MLTMLTKWGRRWAEAGDPWTNVYGFARTLIALATAITLACSHSTTLFRPVAGVLTPPPFCNEGLQGLGYFCMAPAEHVEILRWLAVAVLLVVASGYRPRFTAPLHWWISLSLQMNATVVDGGDQLAANLTLLLLPVALTDGRRWHWLAAEARPLDESEVCRRLVARFWLTLVRVQVAVVYFHAAVGKLPVAEWADGTALYYWLLHPQFGAAAWLRPSVAAVLKNGTALTLLTWSVLVLEYLLSAGLVMARRHRVYLLWGGIALHAGILVLHGLVSFALVMFAALVLYLRPTDAPLPLARLLARLPRLSLRAAPAPLRSAHP